MSNGADKPKGTEKINGMTKVIVADLKRSDEFLKVVLEKVTQERKRTVYESDFKELFLPFFRGQYVDDKEKTSELLQAWVRVAGSVFDEVELLDEFDARMDGYQAGLLLSIHADSCDYINDSATGFKVAAALSETKSENSARLVQCIADRYANITGLRYHYQSVTNDMTRYHAFSEIDPNTTAGIIEVGFLNLDQETLTSNPERLADGIVAGIKCYLNNEGVSTQGTQP